jgi:hypothetical protein
MCVWICDANVDLEQLIPSTGFNKWKLRFQFWPRDVVIRWNMLTLAWVDVKATVTSNDASVFDEMDEEVTAAEFLARFEGLEDQEPEAAANHHWG